MTDKNKSGCNTIIVYLVGIALLLIAYGIAGSGHETVAFRLMVVTIPIMVFLKIAMELRSRGKR